MTWHILYDSYEEDGRDYIGAHSTEDLNDGYMGSYKDKTFNPSNRIAIGYYKSREALIQAEISLQKVLNVARDPQYANRSLQTSTGFDRAGVPDTLETRLKKSEATKGEKNGFYGKTHTKETKDRWSKDRGGKRDSEETRLKKSLSRTGKTQSEETKTKIGDKLRGQKRTEESKEKMRQVKSGENNPAYGRKWWVNRHNETVYQQTSPGSEWQQGRKWKQQ